MFLVKLTRYRWFYGRIHRMRASFRAACAPFIEDIEKLQREVDNLYRRADTASEEIHRDRLLDIAQQVGDQLEEQRQDAEEALMLLRKAFVVATYHFWERGAQRFAPHKQKKPNHHALVAALRGASIVVDEQGLEELRLLVNCLKHNSNDARTLRPTQ
ncbi:hypothetical protein V1291_001522 [Nitrobacteraceae bacterium AZCC 1564]